MTERAPRTLRDLQRFQADFDEQHGLSFPAPQGDRSAELHRIEFACLALAGEVGEFANILKKRRRALWTGASDAVQLTELEAELADILAYTLKLANILKVDLEREYLGKMIVNRERFARKPCVLSLMGPPGGGKTTIARRLEEELQVYVERPELNPDLRWFDWKDERQPLRSQMWFLRSMHTRIADLSPDAALILDQDPQAVVHVYSRIFLEHNWLDDRAFEQLEQMLAEVEERLHAWPGGRAGFLLDASTEVLHERVLERDGASIGVLWIERLRDEFGRLAERIGGVETIRTDQCSADDVVARVKERLLAPV